MPLPKLPTKPAALLSVQDYPKAEVGKTVKPRIAIVEPVNRPVRTAPVAKLITAPAPQARNKPVQTRPVESRKTDKAPSDNPRSVVDKTVKSTEGRPKSSTSRAADKSGVTKLFVLDTNVLMHDPSSLFRFEEHDIYLPMVTLEELDNHKKGMSEVARNARQVSRSLDALVGDVVDDQIDHGIPLSKLGNKDAKGRLFFQTKLQNGTLPEGLPVGKADNQILGVVRALEAETPSRPVVLVSKDINMRIKARAMGLPAEDYFNDHVLEDTDLLYSGIQQLPDDFWIKHGKGIESWQENKLGTGYTFYRLTGPLVPSLLVNQFVFIEPKNGEAAFYGQVTQINGKTAVLQSLRDYAHAKNSVWGVTARNREQNFALNLLMNPECDFVTLLGQAGTGKTLLALAAGLAQVLETKTYNEIIVTRVTVPVGEDIGFLPGTEEEKMGPWMGAFDDNLEVLNKSDSDAGEWGRAATQDLIRSKIKIKSLNFMRGRTFVNKFLIIDEAQNLTPKQIKTLVTRAGPGTKIICLGNIAQIDTPYLTEGSSGLTYVVDRFKGWSHSGHVTLARGERSRLADHASEVL
ncbi:PhoH family protein [Glaciimonas sp. Gout2]|uniref:PhoH family protein n=1 Tax=unclassified Glaciimonas TaxID=2644401 RepID=UPI002AB3F6BD|nr:MULTISPECIES: PhoH family protein [unclassified Glaciimonas]MDY7548178.1 PhoH family protein [Glaciimonas sp. CA11.2]MEB0010665.1 PhoH family protein [Glaciimonas sp. Cout2]MEB0084941.1 PhoH family protein [Glaciimonas sp. Gout2]